MASEFGAHSRSGPGPMSSNQPDRRHWRRRCQRRLAADCERHHGPRAGICGGGRRTDRGRIPRCACRGGGRPVVGHKVIVAASHVSYPAQSTVRTRSTTASIVSSAIWTRPFDPAFMNSQLSPRRSEYPLAAFRSPPPRGSHAPIDLRESGQTSFAAALSRDATLTSGSMPSGAGERARRRIPLGPGRCLRCPRERPLRGHRHRRWWQHGGWCCSRPDDPGNDQGSTPGRRN